MSELRITKHNDLITSRVNFSLNEYRIFLYGISLINPQGGDFPLSYEISIKRFAQMFGCDLDGLYPDLKNNIIKKFKHRSMTVLKPEESKRKKGKMIQVRRNFNLVRYIDYEDNEGYLKIHFDPEIQPFVQNLSELFTSYYIEQVSNFKSAYSIRFYEWCKMELGKRNGIPTSFDLSVQEIKDRLELGDKYDRYNNLKQRVITKAFNEINTYSDLNVRFKEIKTGRSVTKISVTVKYKKWAKKEKQYTLNFDPNLKVSK